MKLTNLKINGISEPMGYAVQTVTVSWRVEEAAGKRQTAARVAISEDPDGQAVLAEAGGEALFCGGVTLRPALAPRTRYFVRVAVRDETGDAAEAVTFFETGKLAEPWQGQWVGPQAESRVHPVLTGRFSAKESQQGRLYLSGLGLYEAYLNGKKVGPDLLAPFLSDYTKEVQYQTYDVSALLREENKLEIYLGNGWYKGRFGIRDQEAWFGDRFAAIAEVYLDGELALKTDESWTWRGSDIAESGIYDGEVLDRQLWAERENPERPVCVVPIEAKLVERISPPLTVRETLTVKEVLHTPAGETVLDFGQNHTGLLEVRVAQPAGTLLTFECGEILQNGNFYHDNYRTAKSRFVYRSDGRAETVRQHFTYFGFRYIRVTGWVGELNPADFTALVVYSDLERTGFLETGNPKINRLYQNTLWGQKSNFLDIPTDCPQRDERLGWTGDAQVFAPTACYNMDTRAFYAKFLHCLRLEQCAADGAVPIYFPSMGDFNTCSVWGDAAVLLPATMERFYDDPALLEQAYPLMRDWADYISRHSVNGLFAPAFGFGDWLAQDGLSPQSVKGGTDDGYISGVYACQAFHIAAEAAGRLSLREEQARFQCEEETARRAVLNQYFTPAGRLSVDTQAAYVIALKFGVYIDREVLLAQFKRRLQYDGYKIKCGFAGAPLMCTTLAENGMTDTAYDLLLNEDFPGWLYAVNLGATTIWERWNSMLPDGTCSGTEMNSFNHYSYGSVMEFVYAYAAGIRPENTGFRSAILAPEPDGRLGFVKASYASTAGTYVCNWSIEPDGQLKVHLEIPFACTAQICLPRSGRAPFRVEAGVYDYCYVPTRDFRAKYGWNTRLEQLRGDAEAIAILERCLPPLAGAVTSGNAELCVQTFADLRKGFMGMNPELLENAVAELEKLLR